mmetsp:Transcript_38952/g.61635  ORF Transcript_38952/g.61635 Transcript_38952/m.61635 type:complete len:152 (-) Transcript_38952:186-641(-)
MIHIFSLLAFTACAVHAKPAENALATLLLNSRGLVNPSVLQSTLRKPFVASRKVGMKELDSEDAEYGNLLQKWERAALAASIALAPLAAFAGEDSIVTFDDPALQKAVDDITEKSFDLVPIGILVSLVYLSLRPVLEKFFPTIFKKGDLFR